MTKVSQAGFTLLEALLTLTLIASVTALLWQSLAWSFQLERRVSEVPPVAEWSTLRRLQLQSTVHALLSGAVGDDFSFEGSQERFFFRSVMAPWALDGPTELWLILTADEGLQRTLVIEAPDGRRIVLLPDLPAASRWVYLDDVGAWHSVWPPPSKRVVLSGAELEVGEERRHPMPKALGLREQDRWLWVGPVQAGLSPLPSLRLLEGGL